MDKNTILSPDLRRVILLTTGPVAKSVAEQTAFFSQAWLGAAPPLAVVHLDDVGAEPALTKTLAAACDRLADVDLAADLLASGWQVAATDAIAVWWLVETAAADGTKPDPAALLADLQASAWRRLRLHIGVRAMMLLEPAEQSAAISWLERLADAGAEWIAVAGPVDAGRLRWPAPVWQERAAKTVAALLWCETGLEWGRFEATKGRVWAVGAAVWPSPAASIHAQAARYCAMQTVQKLLMPCPATPAGISDLPPWEIPGLAIAPERRRLALQTFAPPPLPAPSWERFRPANAWATLADRGDDLTAAATAYFAPARDAHYSARASWLAEQVTNWEDALLQLRDERLSPVAGWPALNAYRLELRSLASQMLVACAMIDDWLETAYRQYAQAEAAAAQAGQALAASCALFPALHPASLAALLVRPWLWPRLLWAYLFDLPARGQAYLSAAGQREQARWHEANTLALQQAHLSMAQAVRERQAEADVYAQRLAAAAALLKHLDDGKEAPAPWSATQVAELAADAAPENGPSLPLLWGVVGDRAGETEPAMEPGLDGLLAWTDSCLSFLETWTAADYLLAALSGAEMAIWPADMAAQSRPLWPTKGRESPARIWLLCPDRAERSGPKGWRAEARLLSQLDDWMAHQHGQGAGRVDGGICAVDAVVILQTVAVDLAADRCQIEIEEPQ